MAENEWNLICGGVRNMSVTVAWEERLDASGQASSVAVTGLSVSGETAGRYTIGGSFSVGGAVIGRLSETECGAEVTVSGIPAAAEGGGFPYVTPVYAHRDVQACTVRVQLWGSNPLGQRFYAAGDIPVELTVQPQASAVEAGGSVIGMPVTIAITPTEQTAVHSLRYEFAGVSGDIAAGLSGGIHTWTPPMELCSAVPDQNAGDCTVYCDTYLADALVGTSAYTLSLRVPEGLPLQFEDGWLTLEPVNDGLPEALQGIYVQGKSCVRGTVDLEKITNEDAYGAQAVTLEMMVDGRLCTVGEPSAVLHVSGERTVKVKVTDSRGKVYTHEYTVSVLPYAAPVMGNVTVFRCDAVGTADERGNSLSVTAGCGFAGLDGCNGVTLQASLRTVGGTWGDPAALSRDEAAVLWTGQISPDDSYELLLRITDLLGASASVTVTLPCVDVFFHGRRGGRGAAFGKIAESDELLEVAWSLKTKGDLVVEGSAVIGGKSLTDWLYPVGAVCTCGEGTDPAVLFGGSWAAADGAVQSWIRTA